MTKENKIYCCSNELRTEAIIIGVIEIICSSFSLLMSAIFAYSYHMEISWLQKVAVGEDMNDLRTFLKLPSETQQLIIITSLLTYGAGIFCSSLLLMGAKYKNAIILKLWFILGVLKFAYTVITTLCIMYTTRHKIFYTAVGVFYILYCLYTLYIVRLFIKELTIVSADSQLQMYPDFDERSVATDVEPEPDHQRF